ncbi:PdaC/SigV domain-containing protein [Tamlana sedimenti]|uniref:PdaC/SigV domain-containing protein n=1 Tax=Tamlana sedimenti TaxID=3134126 RepID=UPI00403EC69C
MFFFLFMLFVACNDETKTSFSEINIPLENNNIVEINIPEAKGNKTITNHINSEISRTVSTSLHIGDPDEVVLKPIEESVEAFNTEYDSFKHDFPETNLIWEAQIDGEVIYQSPEIISIAITSYVNTGGAHGLLNITFLNFESTTGQKIQNDKLMNNLEGFKALAKTYFDKSISEKESIVFESDTFQLPANIAYSESGVVLLYNTYEIAPYSTGIIEFAIPFEEAEPFLVFNNF